jgi:amidase
MARTVADAAIMLGAMEGASPDPHDSATTRCPPPAGRDYTRFLDGKALQGARIGIPRAFYYEKSASGSTTPRGGLSDAQRKAMDEAIAVLRTQGAVIVDPADIPSIVAQNPQENFLLWGICSGPDDGKGKDEDCSVDLKYGMKRDFNAWLASLGPAAPVRTLSELRAWNTAHEKAGAIKYGQAQLDISDEMDVEKDRARYQADRARDIRLAGTDGIDAAMRTHQLDALLFPGSSGSALAARPGYPTVIVPFGFVPNAPFALNTAAPPPAPFPPGFDPKPQPFGVSFTGMACSEPTLLRLAYAFEQATRRRMAPPGLE